MKTIDEMVAEYLEEVNVSRLDRRHVAEFGERVARDVRSAITVPPWLADARENNREREAEMVRRGEIRVEPHEVRILLDFTLGTERVLVGAVEVGCDFRADTLRIEGIPCPSFVGLYDLKIANLGLLCGDWEDAFNYREGVAVDVPTAAPAHRFKVLTYYPGYVPSGHQPGVKHEVSVIFSGKKYVEVPK